MRCRETVTKGTRARGPRLPTADPGSSLKGPILEGHAGHPSMQYQNGLVGYACMPPRIGHSLLLETAGGHLRWWEKANRCPSVPCCPLPTGEPHLWLRGAKTVSVSTMPLATTHPPQQNLSPLFHVARPLFTAQLSVCVLACFITTSPPFHCELLEGINCVSSLIPDLNRCLKILLLKHAIL